MNTNEKQRKKRIFDQVMIGLLVAIILLVAGICIHRATVNSDAFQERKAQAELEDVLQRLRRADDIDYIALFRAGKGDTYHYDFDPGIFADIHRTDDPRITDPYAQNEIIKGECITVFYMDGDYDAFFLTPDGSLYWGFSYRVECPALIDWMKTA